MQYLFAVLLLAAAVACAVAQWPYYAAAPYYNAHHGLAYNAYPYAYNHGIYGYGAINPAFNYLWKK